MLKCFAVLLGFVKVEELPLCELGMWCILLRIFSWDFRAWVMRGQSWMLYWCKDVVWTVVNSDGECGHLSRHWKTTLSADPTDTLWCQAASEISMSECSNFLTVRLICCVKDWMILHWLLCMQASLCQSWNCVHCGWEVVSGYLRWMLRNCCFLNF